MIHILALYFFSLDDIRSAVLMPLEGRLSGWIDFYYRPGRIGKRGAVHPVMMIGIIAGLPFIGIVGFIIGPVLIALVVTGYNILADEAGYRKTPASYS